MPIRSLEPAPSAFCLASPEAHADFLEHARTVLGALQESGMDDEAWHIHQLAEALAASADPITEGAVARAVAQHLRAEGLESQNSQDDPLPVTLIRLLGMAAERVES